MTTTYAAKLAEIRTPDDLVAFDATFSDDLPRPDLEVTDPAESSAVRALGVVSALAPYADGGREDFETAMTDLVADLRHLADHLGVDWEIVTRRSMRLHREELPDGTRVARDRSIPELEIIVVRDPDGPADIEAFLGGEPIDATEYVLDAGAGWHWEDWKERRDEHLAAASPKARASLLGHYDDPPGGDYIEEREGEPWIDDDAA